MAGGNLCKRSFNGMLQLAAKSQKQDTNELTRKWVTACLAKTIKEQTGLMQHVEGLPG